MSAGESSSPALAANRPAADGATAPRAAGESPALSVDQILDGLAEGFFALNSNWRFVAFNRAAEAMFEIARDEVLGKLLWEVSPAIPGSEFDRRYRLVMANREEQEFESYSLRRPDRYHEVRAFPLGDGIGVAIRDATEHQNILQTLRRRELELARVQEIGGVGGMRVDLADGFTAYRSPEYLRLHGLPPDANAETQEDWTRRIHPDDRSRTVEHFLRAVAGGETRYKSEYRIIRPSDGAVRWLRAVGEIERDENAAPIAFAGAHIDITDRKLAEQEALESEEKLRAIADALPVLISYIDKDQTSLRQQGLRDLVRTPTGRHPRPAGERSHEPGDVRGAAALSRARAGWRDRVLRGGFHPLDRSDRDANHPCPASRLHRPHSGRLCRGQRHFGAKARRAKGRRKRGEVSLDRQQRPGADLGDRARRQKGIRQSGLSRLSRPYLRGSARFRLA
jgi:PAS domain S-box-containing protein